MNLQKENYNAKDYQTNNSNIESSIGTKFSSVPMKNMNFYQEIKLEDKFDAEDNEFNHRSMLDNDKPHSPANSNSNSYDPELDEDINEILDELAKELSDDEEENSNNCGPKTPDNLETKNIKCEEHSELKAEEVEKIPAWYDAKVGLECFIDF